MNTSLNQSQLLFQKNKEQILISKKQYLQGYVKQIQNNIASIWESNHEMKNQIEELRKNGKKEGVSHDFQEVVEKYKREEKEKVRKIDELKKLIQEYKFLCEEAARFNCNSHSNNFQSQNTNNTNMNNMARSRSKSHKKIKTKIFCQNCQNNFFPQEYYLHCKECNNDSFSTLRH